MSNNGQIDLLKEEALKLMRLHFAVQAAQADWQEAVQTLAAARQLDLALYDIDIRNGVLIRKKTSGQSPDNVD